MEHISFSQSHLKMELSQKQSTRDNGEKTRCMALEDSYTQVSDFITVTLKMELEVGKELWPIPTKMYTLANGKMETSTGKGHMYSSRQEWNSLENGQEDKSLAENGDTLTELSSLEPLITINQREKESGYLAMEMWLKVTTHRQRELKKLRMTSSCHGRQHQILLKL